MLLTPPDLARQAGVSASVVSGLVKGGHLQAVEMPGHKAFPQPDSHAGQTTLSALQKPVADALAQAVKAAAFETCICWMG
jgi:primosomal protein N' (replication factor Y)